MTIKRFELTTEYIEKFGRKAFKIRALIDFDLPWPLCGKIKTGDTGGYVAKEEFLKQDCRGWVFENGEIWGGVIHDGVIWGGEIWGGEIRGGEIRGGVIHDGVIWGGVIRGGEDLFFIGNVGSSLSVLTATRQYDKSFRIYRGCFNGTIDEFRKAVRETHGWTKQAKQYLAIADLIEYHFTKLHPPKKDK